LESFSTQFGAQAAQNIVRVMGDAKKFGKGSKPTNRYVTNEEISIADDNTRAALFQILAHNQPLSAGNPGYWELLLKDKNLQLKHDTDVGLYVNLTLVQLMKAQRADVLGPNQQFLPAILGLLADVYKTDTCNEELEKELLGLFSQLSENIFADAKSKIKPNQWTKIEKIIRDAQSQNPVKAA
jgi:hypothetical protein